MIKGQKNSFEIEVPPQTKHLAQIRNFIKEVIKAESSLDAEKLDALQLCVTEAASNSMAALKNIKSKEPILVRLDLFSNRTEVEIRDYGRGFDVAKFLSQFPDKKETAKKMAKQKMKEKGMGLPLICALSDKYEIKSSTKGTSIRLTILN